MAKTRKTIRLTKGATVRRIVAQIDTEALPLLRLMTRALTAEVLHAESGLGA